MAATEANPRVTPVHNAVVFCLYLEFDGSLGLESAKNTTEKRRNGPFEFMTLFYLTMAMSHPSSFRVEAGGSVEEARSLGRPQLLAWRVAVFPFEVRCLLLNALWSALPPLPLPPLALLAQQ